MAHGVMLAETAATAPSGACRIVRESLSGCPGATIDEATLLVSAITTWSMATTGAAAVRVTVVHSLDGARVEVHEPPCRSASRRYDDVAGTDLAVIDSVADRWGIAEGQRGRVVWFELSFDRPSRPLGHA